tara:strand:- start:821 stop:1342 length:522 start_codon:yes stop_codon:yes gene_type:complete
MKKVLLLGLLLSVIWTTPINNIVQKYEDGSPKEIHIYEEYQKNLSFKEKRYYYQSGKIKAIGYYSGLKAGSWHYYDESGKLLLEPIDLDNLNNNIDNIYEEFFDNQKVLLKKIENMDKTIKNLALANKNKPADNKKQPPQADPNKVYNVPIGDSFSMGPDDAAVTIIEWSDFQ